MWTMKEDYPTTSRNAFVTIIFHQASVCEKHETAYFILYQQERFPK